MSKKSDDTSLVSHHKFSIDGRGLSIFLLVLFFLFSQDALALSVGDRVVVQNTGSDRLNIRSGAGTSYNRIGTVDDGDKGTIVSGPRSSGGYTWWRVNWDSSGIPTGWSAEADSDGYPVWLVRDTPVKPSISSVGNASATEGNTLSFTVRLSASTSQTETYYYSTYYGGGATAERDDYDGAAEESIRVSSGRSSFTVRISTNEDADFEEDETFYLYVTGEANHPSTTPGSSKYRGTGTIRNDDSPTPTSQISIGNAEATEGNTITFTVTLSPAPTSSMTYWYATYQGSARGGGDDYQGKFATALTFNSGQTSKTIQISTVEDTQDESDEQFYIYITDASNKHPASGTPSDYLAKATGTIRDDDEPVLKPSISSVGNASATEGNTLSFTVRLSSSTSQTETYYYSTYYGGNATAERGDYDGAAEESIRVSSGRSSFTVRISTNEDADFEEDETFYLYVTGEANHPNTTPGSSKYRGTGTIRNDDSPTTTSLTRLYWEIVKNNTIITDGVDLTIRAGQSAKMVAVFNTQPVGTFTFKIYEADVSGDQLVKDTAVSPFSVSVPATRAVREGSTYKLSASWTSIFRSGTETVSPYQAEYYFTVEQGGTVYGNMLTDANTRTGISNKLGPLLGVEVDPTSSTPTPPNPSAPSGTHKYMFSLDDKTYTVTSDDCYSEASNRSKIENYIDGLRIYNSSNELVRPANDILFQLTAAHASACMIDGVKFSNIDEDISLAQERNNQLREEVTKGKTTSQITAGIAAIITVAGAVAIISTGGLVTPLVFGVLGLAATGVGLFVVAENKEDLALVVADLFLTSKRGLDQAKEWSREIENYDLTATININDLNSKMYKFDGIIDNITFARQWLSDGRDLAIELYPKLEGSTWDKRLDTIFIYERTIGNQLGNVFLQKTPGIGTVISGIEDLGEAINIRHIGSKLDEHLSDIHNHNIADVKSPFKTMEKYKSNIYGYALIGTGTTDVMRNFASGAELFGGNGDDWMYGENGITIMDGEGGSDRLFGGSQHDLLIGGPGNDELRGGGGQDIARFSGNRGNYDMRWDSAGEWLMVSSSADGNDRVYKDIESLSFRDETLATSDIEAPAHNLPPVLAGHIEDQIAFAGDRFEYYIPSNIFVDPEGDTLTWRVSGLPGWLHFNSTTRLLSGTPTVNDAGQRTITVSVTGAADSETFALSVIKPNSPPVLTVPNAPYTVAQDGGWTRLSGLSVTDADNDDLSVVVGVKYGQLRATGTMVEDLDVSSDDVLSDAVGFRKSSLSRINAALATLEYRPANNWESGQDVLILLVGDAIVETPVPGFTFIYSETKPVFSDAVSNRTYTVGTAISTLTLPEATGGQAPLTYSLTPTVPGLTFTASTRTLSGTPTQAGTHDMIYKVTDASGNTDTETFRITVEGAVVTADFNGDGRVNIDDYLLFFLYYGLSEGDAGYDARYDLDSNGTIGVVDFMLFVNSYGKASS